MAGAETTSMTNSSISADVRKVFEKFNVKLTTSNYLLDAVSSNNINAVGVVCAILLQWLRKKRIDLESFMQKYVVSN